MRCVGVRDVPVLFAASSPTVRTTRFQVANVDVRVSCDPTHGCAADDALEG